jgi:hypothetical protein
MMNADRGRVPTASSYHFDTPELYRARRLMLRCALPVRPAAIGDSPAGARLVPRVRDGNEIRRPTFANFWLNTRQLP